LVELWESYYPLEGIDPLRREIFARLERTTPALVETILNHRPRALRGNSLFEALQTDDLRPGHLRESLQRWRSDPRKMYQTRPIVAFAAIGQGRADGKITPEEESVVIGKLLTHWALTSTLSVAARCSFTQPDSCPCESRGGARGPISNPSLNSIRSISWHTPFFAVG
jgi:hypothetical protein